MQRETDTYTYRRSGMAGCEILADGETVGWTIDDYWAVTICRLLNNHSSISVGTGLVPLAACCCGGTTTERVSSISE
jgi:hypothetical protein